MKFRRNISYGFQVIERTRYCADRRGNNMSPDPSRGEGGGLQSKRLSSHVNPFAYSESNEPENVAC